jgi:hypothetical protein
MDGLNSQEKAPHLLRGWTKTNRNRGNSPVTLINP